MSRCVRLTNDNVRLWGHQLETTAPAAPCHALEMLGTLATVADGGERDRPGEMGSASAAAAVTSGPEGILVKRLVESEEGQKNVTAAGRGGPAPDLQLEGEEARDLLSATAPGTETAPLTPSASKKRRTAAESWGHPERAGHSRTLYLGNVPAGLPPHEIFNSIRGGAVESLRYLSEKNCAFVDFCSAAGALAFWQRLPGSRRLEMGGAEVRIGWAQSSAVNPTVEMAIKNGATRCIYISPWDEEADEATLQSHFEPFGALDTVKIVRERGCAFVYMTSVADAIKAISVLSARAEFAGKRVNFGKDRCGGGVGGRDAVVAATAAANTAVDATTSHPLPTSPREGRQRGEEGEIPTPQAPTLGRPATTRMPALRTIYLGGVPEGTTAQDLCNIIRGGMLEKIRLTPERRCAFVTFIEAEAAAAFHVFAEGCGGIWVRGCRLKLGWGQESYVPNAVTAALRLGATRNVYLGNVDLDRLGEPALLEAASAFGPVETVNLVRRPRQVAFVAFCCLLDAVKAVECWRTADSMFAQCTVSFGKDRCAAPLPRPVEAIKMTIPSPGGVRPIPGSPLSVAVPAGHYAPSQLPVAHHHHQPPPIYIPLAVPMPVPCLATPPHQPPPYHHQHDQAGGAGLMAHYYSYYSVGGQQ